MAALNDNLPAVCQSLEPKGQWERATRITSADTFLSGKSYLIVLTKRSQFVQRTSQKHHNLPRAVHWTEGSIVLCTAVVAESEKTLKKGLLSGQFQGKDSLRRYQALQTRTRSYPRADF